MARTITKIERLAPLPARKRTAAYARVSSGKDSMLHSLAAQVSYYNDLIQSNPEWIFAGVYPDEAYTGTADERPEFMRLITDCRAGQIDLVITKSISRFARNTLTLLETIRELSGLGIDVYFEEEGIHSKSADGELMLTLIGSFAQEESRSVSENCKWRIRKNFAEGKPYGLHKMLGYRIKDGVFTIVPEEAEIVRRIFAEYLDGKGIVAIIKGLLQDGVSLGRSTVAEILRNVTYTGDLLLQRTYITDHLTKKQLPNKGALPQYHIENDHEGIISQALFDAVQTEISRRKEKYRHEYVPMGTYAYTGLIRCGKCGCIYKRKITPYRIVWVCPTFNTLGKAVCPSQQIPEEVLERLIAERGGLSAIAEIIVPEANRLFFRFKDGREEIAEWHTSRRDSWTEEMKEAARQRRYEQETRKAGERNG